MRGFLCRSGSWCCGGLLTRSAGRHGGGLLCRRVGRSERRHVCRRRQRGGLLSWQLSRVCCRRECRWAGWRVGRLEARWRSWGDSWVGSRKVCGLPGRVVSGWYGGRVCRGERRFIRGRGQSGRVSGGSRCRDRCRETSRLDCGREGGRKRWCRCRLSSWEVGGIGSWRLRGLLRGLLRGILRRRMARGKGRLVGGRRQRRGHLSGNRSRACRGTLRRNV